MDDKFLRADVNIEEVNGQVYLLYIHRNARIHEGSDIWFVKAPTWEPIQLETKGEVYAFLPSKCSSYSH